MGAKLTVSKSGDFVISKLCVPMGCLLMYSTCAAGERTFVSLRYVPGQFPGKIILFWATLLSRANF